jgi:hypothetical protein
MNLHTLIGLQLFCGQDPTQKSTKKHLSLLKSLAPSFEIGKRRAWKCGECWGGGCHCDGEASARDIDASEGETVVCVVICLLSVLVFVVSRH